MKNTQRIVSLVLIAVGLTAGCSEYSKTPGVTDMWTKVEQDANHQIARFKETDPSMQKFFDTAAGYAVFPEIAKGGAGIGAAHGEGVLYEGAIPVGYCDMKQGSIGLQLGGQMYAEIIFFQDAVTLGKFKTGEFEFAAQASAVAASSGAAATADYVDGVAVFSRPLTGLMFEASVGGQKFKYWDKQP